MFPSIRPGMRSTPPTFLRILMLCVALSASLGLPSAQARPSTPEILSQGIPDPVPSALAVQNLPTALSFVPAGGRGHNDDVRFEVRGAHGTLFLTPRETVFALPTTFPPRRSNVKPEDMRTPGKSALGIVRQRFLGAAPHPKLSGLEPQPTLINEYLGERSEDWRTNLPSYGAVQYYAVYPGIDLRYDGVDGQLKRSFLLAPGADASQIRWQYQGVDSIRIDPASGDMQLQVMVRLTKAQQDALDTAEPTMPITLTERAPRAWQETPQGRVNVPVQFVLEHGHKVGFTLGAYDQGLPLVIDPEIFYWAGFDSSQSQGVNDMVLTPDINNPALLFLGRTTSTAFGTLQGTAPQVGTESIYVSKRSVASGAVTWYTYFGGGSSSTINQGTAIATDASGNALITGSTSAAVFPRVPTTAQACSSVKNVFVSRLQASTGTLTASRCLGLPVSSSSPNEGRGIAVDPQSGSVWVAGVSGGGDFLSSLQAPQQLPRIYGLAGPGQPVPVRPTVPHGFLVKLTSALDAAQTRIYFGTFFAGAAVADLALDGQGRPVVVGRSVAAPSDDAMGAADRFPSTTTGYQTSYSYGGNFYDGYVMRLSADGQSKVYGSWLGDVSTYDDPESVTVGRDITDAGDVYVAGSTSGPNLEGQRSFATPPSMDTVAWLTLRGSNRAGFVVRINPAASGAASLRYGSLLRSTGSTQYIVDVRAVAARNGVAYLVGDSQQGDMLLNPVQASTGSTDAFVAALDTTSKAMTLSSYIGSTGIDAGHAVEVLRDGSVLVGGQLNAYTTSAQAYVTLINRLPLPTLSYYERTVDETVHRKQGCSARARGEQGVAILFYGSPRISDTGTYGAGLKAKGKEELTPASVTEIQQAVVAFADGYVHYQACAGLGIIVTNPKPARLNLLVTTSNSMFTDVVTYERRLNPALTAEHGQQWAQMVLAIKQELFTKGIGDVTVAGGYDAEPDWWYVGPIGQRSAQPAPTFDWANGYNSVSGRLPYFFIGSTDGGPRDSSWINNGSVPLLDQVFDLAWGIAAARPLPQIYNAGYAKEWYQLRRYSIIRKQRPMVIQGVLTECGSSGCSMTNALPWTNVPYDFVNSDTALEKAKRQDFTPQQGWQAMDDALQRTLIDRVIIQQPLTPPWNSSLLQLPGQRLSIPADASCQPNYLSFGYQSLVEPHTTLLPSSCLPAGSILPTDTTLPHGWYMPTNSTTQVFFSVVAPQPLPLLTDICYAQRKTTEHTSGVGQCVR